MQSLRSTGWNSGICREAGADVQFLKIRKLANVLHRDYYAVPIFNSLRYLEIHAVRHLLVAK